MTQSRTTTLLDRHLVGILESLGHRTDLARSSP